MPCADLLDRGQTQDPSVLVKESNARSLTPTSTPTHEARVGDPGSRAEDCARLLTGIRDDGVIFVVVEIP
jgi:hypothetical protein